MTENGFWVFGYGSLVWQPGFEFAEKHIARLDGFSRTFCMRSIHHRGSVEAPGLVLALDPHVGACCDGIAFRVAPERADATLAYLRERELVSSAYVEQSHDVSLSGGGTVQALCYVVDTEHVQYCGGLSLAEQAAVIASAVGGRGPNTEYLFNTALHLRELGIEDAYLNALENDVRALTGQTAICR